MEVDVEVDGAAEQVEQARAQSGMAGREEADPAREGEHPLPHGDRGEDVLDEVLGGVLHPASVAGRADVGLAGEGHQPLETAVGTADSREAAGEDAAVEVGAQLALDEGRQAPAMGTPLSCGGEERLEPFADPLVQERLLWLAPPVPAERRGSSAGVTLPGLCVLGRNEHARAHRKGRALPVSSARPLERAVAMWMVPTGMTSHVHAFDPREGCSFRISLTYDAPTGTGKTTAHTDTFHGRFVKLVTNVQVVDAAPMFSPCTTGCRAACRPPTTSPAVRS